MEWVFLRDNWNSAVSLGGINTCVLLCTKKASVTLTLRTLECPRWQLERRGHFRRHSLNVAYLLCTFSVY